MRNDNHNCLQTVCFTSVSFNKKNINIPNDMCIFKLLNRQLSMHHHAFETSRFCLKVSLYSLCQNLEEHTHIHVTSFPYLIVGNYCTYILSKFKEIVNKNALSSFVIVLWCFYQHSPLQFCVSGAAAARHTKVVPYNCCW